MDRRLIDNSSKDRSILDRRKIVIWSDCLSCIWILRLREKNVSIGLDIWNVKE